MVSPQIEEGYYTRIANELMEHVPRFRFNGTQLRIILVIWRYTYGFRRSEHDFALTFLANATGASRSQCDRELTALIERNVLHVVSGGNGRSRVLRFNKDYTEWINERRPRNGGHSNEETVLQNEDAPSSALGTEPSSALGTKKERKKTLKKDMSSLSIHEQIISYLNQKTGKRYSARSEANKKLINGRINEGRTLEDFKYVIDVKVNHWLEDEKMNEYLRPDTLFRPGNFDKYMNQQPKTQKGHPSGEDRDRKLAEDDALREWVMAGNDPEQFRYNSDS